MLNYDILEKEFGNIFTTKFSAFSENIKRVLELVSQPHFQDDF